jgi:y4mF family transcriptional regulator
MNQLAAFLKEHRKRARITQREAADKSGVGLRFVRELEQGKTTLRLDKVNQLLALFSHEMAPARKHYTET